MFLSTQHMLLGSFIALSTLLLPPLLTPCTIIIFIQIASMVGGSPSSEHLRDSSVSLGLGHAPYKWQLSKLSLALLCHQAALSLHWSLVPDPPASTVVFKQNPNCLIVPTNTREPEAGVKIG